MHFDGVLLRISLQKKRGKSESDDDFVPGGKRKNGRKVKKGRHKKTVCKNGTEEDSGDTDDLDEMFEPESEEEELHFSSTDHNEEEELESDGSEYVPYGRNAKRAAALKRTI